MILFLRDFDSLLFLFLSGNRNKVGGLSAASPDH
jgi:hypothetical protein